MNKQIDSSWSRLLAPLWYIWYGIVFCCLLSSCKPSPEGLGLADNPEVTPSISPALHEQGTTQIQTFQRWISLLHQFGGNTSSYEQSYRQDQHALQEAHTSSDYQAALTLLSAHIISIQLPTMKTEAEALQQQLQQTVTAWGQSHIYHNPTDQINYPLGFEYGAKGIGLWIQNDLVAAQTISDYQQAIENEQMYLTNFAAMQRVAEDQTPYYLAHQSDLDLLKQKGDLDKKALVISLNEQVLRAYDHGTLVKAFLVTTGRPDRPSIPGDWWIEGKQTHTIFKAGLPQSDPGWYPDTPVNYAMQYHSNGYFIHDSWWRDDYGPGTNFPHQDASGDIYSSQGSHGCVNLSKANAAWLYDFVAIYTPVIVY
ncbi:L,D-transpeptidase [Tengunoibacter tsumagoiensis]|uniref:L,D-TPase catalytic domain-containing protein n=1 Tax=Tengunoibacter tsumagoiensis TaxID=2014871 RepID=A0A402A1H0_9CHLR|nr:L,D-transpeptidase [Tengunoibacter tsumagoiensis]GCE12983.1 hypothetical protein KTT_28420 [Tengunoibacter tsumagoiensis]